MSRISPEIALPFVELDRSLTQPLYLQLYEKIKSGILSGMLKEGERMPATRTLANELSVSRNSVLLAFEQLILEGYLSGKTGAGTFVCKDLSFFLNKRRQQIQPSPSPKQAESKKIEPMDYPLSEEILIKDSQVEPAKPFQLSVPAFTEFPFAAWAKIAAGVYRNIHSLHLGYDDAQGYLPLRKALTDYLRMHRSINCTPDQIVMVNGSRQGLHLAAQLLLKKGDLCWIEDPGYHGAKVAFTKYGGKLCPVPVTAQGLNIDYASENFPAAKVAYVTPSHQYPLGGTMPLSRRLKLLQWAADHKMWIIEDDYDSEFRYNGRPIPALQGLDTAGNVIYIGTFSKVLFPALRMGYVVLPSAQVAQQFKFAKSITDRQSPVIDQAILSEFIVSGHFSRHIRRMRMLYNQKQEELISLLNKHLADEVIVSPVNAGMHVVAWLTKHKKADKIVAEASKRGIILHAVEEFAIKFRPKAGLLMGFTGFSYKEMERAVIVLRNCLNEKFKM
ncbi:MAG TPA: PLP-dependent aminotransferase family protein [Chitinophagaceae bacterium]